MANGREVYNLTFQREMADQPILHELGKRFRVAITLLRAMLSEEAGWVEVALDGPEEEIGRAIADLHTTGVNITGPISDVVERDEERQTAGSGYIGRGT